MRRADGVANLASTRARSDTTHLTREHWTQENRAIVCKALSEWAHERLIVPRQIDMAGEALCYEVAADDNGVVYRFCARRMPLEHWAIDPSSVERLVDGRVVELDAGQLVLDLCDKLGLSGATAPTYVEEMLSTLYAGTYRRAKEPLTAQDLLHADFQEIEHAMTEGHPCFVANGGRVGFDIRDHAEYAPEAARPMKLLWLAARRERAEFRAIDSRDHTAWMDDVLGERTRERFESLLVSRGLSVGDYVFVPAHPWQWRNKLSAMMAADLAAERLVFLGESEDVYQAQQSVRTFFNRSRPAAPYVKVALSVRNMGFMRGLSSEYMAVTPAINAHLSALIDADPFFAAHGFELLREVASVGFRSQVLEAVLPTKSPYRKMLAGLYRESPVSYIHSGARLCTMASLLHRDRTGKAMLPLMIQASGLSVDGWLERYFRAYLLPLVHAFYRYGLVFMPHGENVILELEEFAPRRAFMKDLAEEAVIMDRPQGEVPPEVRRIYLNVPEEIRTLSIFTDVFDGVFRFIAQILEDDLAYSHGAFWSAVKRCLRTYVNEHERWVRQKPRQSLFASTFRHSCLNRLQLRDNRQMVDLLDPAASLLFAGELENPVALG
jgi:siderophore synthetase component